MVKRRPVWFSLVVAVFHWLQYVTFDLQRRIVETAAAVTVGVLAPPIWKLVERLFSARVRTALQVNERMCINAYC